MSEIMIRTKNLTKCYGILLAVNNVSLEIPQGAIVGLVGKNGAGKTTLIRLLTGLSKPTSGEFELLPGQQRKDNDVAAIVERPSIYLDMTAMDNLVAQCKLLELPADTEYLHKTLVLVGLNPHSPVKAKNYSLGMKQRLAIAMTLVGKPKLLILDEPTNGLDPQGMHNLREIFVRLNKEFGTTLVISSHILAELSKFATEFYFMHKGKIIKHATLEELEKYSAGKIRLSVNDAQKAMALLEQYGAVTQVGENVLDLTTETPITQIMLTLAQNEVVVHSVAKAGDALEDFFIDLLKKPNDTTPTGGAQ